ncbi:MAG: aminotransferase class I/II-fold pyridoxal phosphate-dependent enzyme, partial [bacterium]
LAVHAGIAVLKEKAYAKTTQRTVRELREELFVGLQNAGLEPFPSEANFILCRVPDAGFLCQELLCRGIAARNCDSFTGLEKNRYVRFAVRMAPENSRLLNSIEEIMKRCPAAL